MEDVRYKYNEILADNLGTSLEEMGL